MSDHAGMREMPEDQGQDGVSLTVRVSPLLHRKIVERSRILGLSQEECASQSLARDFSEEERFEPVISEFRKISAKNDQAYFNLKQNLSEINETNRIAYEGLLKSLKPDRKDWKVIGGAGGMVGILMIVAFMSLGRTVPEHSASPAGAQDGKPAIPAQMSAKDRYTYFVGRWYLGVRDRMSTKERLFLENYLKPFDNFDEDLKARKKAGL